MKKRNFDRIGEGGSSLVYKSKGLVVKLDAEISSYILELSRQHKNKNQFKQDEIDKVEVIKHCFLDIKQEYDDLFDIFRENISNIKLFWINKENILKLDDVLLFNIFKSIIDRNINDFNLSLEDIDSLKNLIINKSLEIPIIVQKKVEDIKNDNCKCFCSGVPNYENYLEKFNFETEEDMDKAIESVKDFMDKNIKKSLSKLDINILESEAFQSFLKKLILYTKKTHKMIDIFGINNIIFTKNCTNYLLLDPVFKFDKSQEKYTNFNQWIKNNKDHNIRHSYVYIKTINILAEKFNLEKIHPIDIYGDSISNIEKDVNIFFDTN